MIPRIREALALWDDNKAALLPICDRIAAAFDLPSQMVADTVRRRLIMDFAEKNQLGGPGLLWKISSVFWLLLSMVAGHLCAPKKDDQRRDVLLDYWGGDNFIHYREAYEAIGDANMAVFSRLPQADGYPAGLPVIYRKPPFMAPPRVALKGLLVLGRYLVSRAFKKKRNISIFYVIVILIRKIGQYYYDVYGLNSDVFLSSGDNYFEGVRYAIYKQSSIKSVQVIQNGVRGAWLSDVFLYSDVYYSMGEDISAAIPEHHPGVVIPVGSVRGAENCRAIGDDVPISFDLTFIEQLFDYDIDGTGSMFSYDKLVKDLVRFAREHPQLSICVATRPLRETFTGSLADRRDGFDELMDLPNVRYSDRLGMTSYGAVAASKMVLAYTSTLAMEAALFDRPYLYCYDDELLFLQPSGIGHLFNPSYEEMADRILAIMNSGDRYRDYYREESRKHMIPNRNPGTIIGLNVRKFIGSGECTK